MMNKASRFIFSLILITAFIGYACQDQSLEPANTDSNLTSNSLVTEDGSTFAANHNRNFRAHLNTAQEVPEPSGFERNPQGQAIFQLSRDGSELSYKLIVSNIENVLMAHIHLAPVGDTGGVVVWLYPEGPPPQLIQGRSDGVLAEGVITDASLIGVLEDGALSDLIDEIQSGNAYVNVHTSQNTPGEIRGQIY